MISYNKKAGESRHSSGAQLCTAEFRFQGKTLIVESTGTSWLSTEPGRRYVLAEGPKGTFCIRIFSGKAGTYRLPWDEMVKAVLHNGRLHMTVLDGKVVPSSTAVAGKNGYHVIVTLWK